jgi:orotidine-5'-phosphate decarboxylase
MAYDAITLSPYMGYDSLEPFLEYKDKWAIVLGLTSNPGYEDVQMATLSDGRYLFEKVMNDLANKVSSNKLMFVVGATRSSLVKAARAAAPDHFFPHAWYWRSGWRFNAVHGKCHETHQ